MSFSRTISSGPGLMILPDGSVSTAKLANFAVDADKIANGAIIADKLADEAVRTAAIEDGAVTNSKIDDDAVRESAIQADAVTADKISAGAITADKIAVDAVTTTKILDDAVTNDKIADGHIESYHFAAEAVDTAALEDGAVTDAKVASITYAKISDPPTIPALSAVAAAALGVAAAGVATTSARGDHVHPAPAIADVTGLQAVLDEIPEIKGVMENILEITTVAAASGAIAISMTAGGVQNRTINGTASFTASDIDAVPGFSFTISVFLTASGGDQAVSFDSNWKWIGSKPTSIASGVTGMLTLTNRGSASTDIVASYAVLGAG